MTTSAAGARTDVAAAAQDAPVDAALGWYLYGITRRGALDDVLAEGDALDGAGADPSPSSSDAAPLQQLELGELCGVVRPVPVADFDPALLRERLHSAAALEAMVRSHNAVIEGVHRRQAILPAKFGSVYSRSEDVLSALLPLHDDLLAQLDRLEGCDEWAVHLYADSAAVRERVSGEAGMRRLREECAAARPGRAWFLERQLREQEESAAREALLALAQGAFERLAGCAVAGRVNPVMAEAEGSGEVEILRAAFLVPREEAERFQAEVCSAADASLGLSCDYSGPWPPYSFAAGEDEEAE